MADLYPWLPGTATLQDRRKVNTPFTHPERRAQHSTERIINMPTRCDGYFYSTDGEEHHCMNTATTIVHGADWYEDCCPTHAMELRQACLTDGAWAGADSRDTTKPPFVRQLLPKAWMANYNNQFDAYQDLVRQALAIGMEPEPDEYPIDQEVDDLGERVIRDILRIAELSNANIEDVLETIVGNVRGVA